MMCEAAGCLLFAGLGVVIAAGVPMAAAGEVRPEKTVFTISMHCYPYNRDYSDFDYADRPLDWDPTLEGREGAHRKMVRMQEAGIDVNAQTVFYGNNRPPVGGDTTTGLSTLGLRFDACEGTSVRIAPEICAVNRSLEYGLEDLAGFFREMIEDYGDHPRWFRYRGKRVVFLWNPFDDLEGPAVRFGPDQLDVVWRLLGEELRESLYVVNETYYMVKRENEYVAEHWNEDGYIDRMLEVVDNAFWWFGWPDPETERFRAGLLAETLREKTDEPVIVGIRPGYYRKNTGILNPHRVTAKFRGLWEANMTVDPDWVYFYSWDDYSENGQIEPTRFNRGAYSALARAMTAAWKGNAASLPPERWIGYPLSLVRGQDLRIESVLLAATSAWTQVVYAFEDAAGREVFRSVPSEPEPGPEPVVVYPSVIPTEGDAFRGVHSLTPVVYAEDASGRVRAFRGLNPVRLRRHHPTTPMNQFVRLDQVRAPASLEFTLRPKTNPCAAEVEFAVAAGPVPLRRIELRDGRGEAVPFDSDVPLRMDVVGKMPFVDDEGANPSWFEGLEEDRSGPFYLPLARPVDRASGSAHIDTRAIHDPRAMLCLFLEYEDGATWASRPDFVALDGGELRWPVIDFQGEKEETRVPVGEERLAAAAAVVAHWDAASYRPGHTFNGAPAVLDSGCMGYPLYLGYGPNSRILKDSPERHPEYNAEEGVFELSGTNQVFRLHDFVFPAGAFTIEFEIRPDGFDGMQALLWHKRDLADIRLDTRGRVLFARGENENRIGLASNTRLQAGEWSRVTLGDDGKQLFLFIDGKPDATLCHRPLWLNEPHSTWSDIILVGGRLRDRYFRGAFRELRILSSVPPADMLTPPEELSRIGSAD
ncbi:MAG: hypothetical protein JW951_02485 [Lentisphaerae bacterium]|nr:hypothetical protein [Lentisphaerota bacterium]